MSIKYVLLDMHENNAPKAFINGILVEKNTVMSILEEDFNPKIMTEFNQELFDEHFEKIDPDMRKEIRTYLKSKDSQKKDKKGYFSEV